MADGVTITVYRVDKAFHGSTHYTPEYPDEMEYSVVETYLSLMRAVPEAQPLFNDLDAYIEEVNLVSSHSNKGLSNIYPSFSTSCYTVWDENTRKMLADDAIMAAILGVNDDAKPETLTVGERESTIVGQVLESYLFCNMAANVGDWVRDNAKSQEKSCTRSVKL